MTTTKLLACDLDGTIVFDREIRERDKAALERWRADGNVLVTATGKSIFGTRSVLDGTGMAFDYHVMYSGAVVTDGRYRVLAQHTIQDDLFAEVVTPLLGREHVAVYATTLHHDFQLANHTGGHSGILPVFTPLDPAEIPRHEFVGIALYVSDPDVLDELEAGLSDRYGTYLECHRNQDFLDLVHRPSSKGTGLEWLCEHHLRDRRLETYTLGDSWNDIPMHVWSDHPVTFDYAPEDVRKECELVVGHAYELVDDVLARAR